MKNREIRAIAMNMRRDGKTLTEICETISKPKGTVYSWIKDIPYSPSERTSKQKFSQIEATKAMQKKYKTLREAAYNDFRLKQNELLNDKFIRDFIIIYLTEGFRKSRNHVSVANSNPKIIKISYFFIKKFTAKKIFFTLQYHADQDINFLLEFWSKELNVNKESIKVTRKSNSGKLEGRVWNSKYGVLTVGSNDTYLRAKIQALMDVIEEEWNNNFSSPNTLINYENSSSIPNSRRKIKNRPPKEELLQLILEKPFVQIGKDYGVSDNAIRKWCKYYDLPHRKKDIEEYKNKHLLVNI